MELPKFTYHPEPIITGVIERSEKPCLCCGKAHGYIYVGPVYSSEEELDDQLCPWCIADGSAAERLGASFADSHPLLKAGIAPAIVEEIHLRTPAFMSWQEPEWLSHCNDACEFHGDASAKDVAEASSSTKADWLARNKANESKWALVTDRYRPGGDSALYKFICRHCGMVLFGWDLS